MTPQARSIIANNIRLLKKQKKRDIAEWCESEMWIDEKTPFKFRYAPYLKEMIETPMNTDVRRTVYMMFSRGGKTTAMNAVMGYSIAEQPRHIAMMQSKLETAEQFSKEDFQEKLVSNTPCLARLLPEGRTTKNTIRHKMFPGGVLKFVGANTASSLRRIKANLLLADEVDSYEGDDEGDVLKIFWKRGSEYGADTIQICASYPGVAGSSRIWDEMQLSDWRRFNIPCTHCKEWFAPERERDLKWPKGEPELAYIECPFCKAAINERQRRESVSRGKWIATRPFRGVAGFHAGSLIWPHASTSRDSFIADLAREVEDALASSNPPAAMQVIQTTHDAIPYQPEALPRPEPDTIRARAETYNARQALPDGVLWIGAGVDVQQDWLEVSVIGFGLAGQTWAIDHQKIIGSSDEQGTWTRLQTYMEACKFPHKKLGILPLLQHNAFAKRPKVLVDSGKWPEIVRKFTKKLEARGVYACKGHPSLDADPVHQWYRCKTTLAWVCYVGVNQIKDTVYRLLENNDPSADGYIHFPAMPAYGDDYFGGLVGEEPKRIVKGGKVFSKFETPDGLRNEPLDTMVYARAAFHGSRPRLSETKPAAAKVTFARSNFLS